MRATSWLFLLFAAPWALKPATNPTDEFAATIRPILAANCAACHNSSNPRGPVDFLKAQTVKDVESKRGLWRNVSAQLRNRTMPPVASKLTEQDRLLVSSWIDQDLRRTACAGDEYAGAVQVRRLNRRDYRNTIRDLLGVDLDVSQLFPEDGTGGEGFDTDGETLYVPPLLMERYMQAAQQILDRAIVTPPLIKSFSGSDLQPAGGAAKGSVAKGTRLLLAQGDEATGSLGAYFDGQYGFTVSIARPRQGPMPVTIKVDGQDAGVITFPRYESDGATTIARNVTLTRGAHTIAVAARQGAIQIIHVEIAQKAQEISAERKALHYRLFGLEPGQMPLEPRQAAQRLLAATLRKAYRRPLEAGELDPFLKLYDRAAERGDPYEERVKLALKGILVSTKFLFRIEAANTARGIHPLRDHELATRLSYFLWSTMPDEELSRLADQGKLQDPKTLAAQLDRMIDDPRSRVFAETFVGQWLGTKDVGGRVVPALNDLQDFYTPEVAADLRQEPVLLFHYMMSKNRPLLDLLNADYTFLSSRLVKFYQLDDKLKNVGPDFERVQWPDNRRGGVFGMGSVLAMTSHYKQTSPVLRGAWVLENLLGTTVPPPPPDVPPLEAAASKDEKLTIREKLERHRANASCATCHKMMDPIGFGLENFDWMGRWREEDSGKPVDASAALPSGDRFTGPVELRQAMLKRKDEFLSTVTGKALGYALGRSLQDGDQCTVQRIVQALEKDNFGTRTLLRQIVLSVPFRNSQGDAVPAQPAAPPVPRRRQEKN